MKRDYKTAFIITVLILILFIFNYLGLIRAYAGFILHNIIEPLGIDELPVPVFLTIAGIIVNIPTIGGWIAWVIYRRKSQGEVTSGLEMNPLDNLESARNSLEESINYLNKLEEEIKLNTQKRKELSDVVDTLDSISKEKSEDLRKKLKAIEYVNKNSEYKRMAFAFILGVISSLLASAIWMLITK